ncbi:hypothetical protein EVAR_4980_1 [Eumeta japonica]|uniref:Uncharacterized protein n=1 Tax=Eumeta variegata TaxID=151549 RepID=A0A4C1V0J9_EUMVA|nr:hypothetical protein EVAR_4980_1 [Eumeta japonica]
MPNEQSRAGGEARGPTAPSSVIQNPANVVGRRSDTRRAAESGRALPAHAAAEAAPPAGHGAAHFWVECTKSIFAQMSARELAAT